LCEPNFDLKNCSTGLLVSPCSCTDYSQCVNQVIVTSQCAPGTTFDGKGCTDEKFVCDDNETPWNRCIVTDDRLEQLKILCSPNISTTSTQTLPQTTVASSQTTEAPSAISAGLVIGLIIAGAVFAIVVIALVIWFRKRRKHSGIPSKRGTLAENPEYFENGNRDDPYDTIPGSIPDMMSDPTYNSEVIENSTLSPSNGTFLPSRMEPEEVEYDNSAFKEEPNKEASGYTDTLRRSIREYETPISATAKKSEGTSADDTASDFGANGSNLVDGRHSADIFDSDMNTDL
ncbi:hypothetical protein MAR_010698, partial [Mya arenaria]